MVKVNTFKEFKNLQHTAMGLVQKGKYEEALSLLEKAKSELPDRIDRIGHWKAAIYMLQGEQKQALSELQEVLQKGLWWNPEILKNDEELKPLQNTKEFSSILDQCERTYKSECMKSEPLLQVEGNPQADTSIFALHWKGSNAKDFASEWFNKTLWDEYLFAFPQSSQLFSFNCYSWDNREVAEKDLKKTFHKFQGNYEVNRKNNIIAGASQGGKKSIELLFEEGWLDFEGFIALVPAIEDSDHFKQLLYEKSRSNVKGCIITGDQDPFYKNTLEVVDLLHEHGISCELKVIEGMGHTLPEDFTFQINKAIESIITNGK